MSKNESVPRVLLISPLPPPPGGDSTWALRYMEYSKSKKLPFDIVNTAVIGARAKGVDKTKSIGEEIVRCFKIWSKIIVKIKKIKPQVVHMNTNCSPIGIVRDYVNAKIVRACNIPLITHCRCNIEDQLGHSKIGNYFFKKVADLSEIIIVLNMPSKEYSNRLSSTCVKIVPNFISEEFLQFKHREINEKIKQVAFVGHVKKTKGIIEIIETAKRFKDINFVIAGPITEEFVNYNLDSNVKLIGSQSIDSIRNLLVGSDVFLFPTYTEGFSNALLEAMSTGIPIITTDVGANKDMLEGKGGIIVDKKNYNQIIDAVEQLKSQDIRRGMSRWNIIKVNNYYTIEKVMKELIEIYRGVL